MKLGKLLLSAAGLLVPAAMANAYSLSLSSAPTLPDVPVAASSVTLTMTLSGAASESILSAQALVAVVKPDDSPQAGLTLSSGTGLGAGMIFAQYSDANSGNISTQSASSPTSYARYRALFVPTNEDGFPVPQTLTDGVLMTVVLNIAAGTPEGTYPIKFIGGGTPGGSDATDTFISLSDSSTKNADALTGTTLVILPEPASALLLLGALPFLRRRTA